MNLAVFDIDGTLLDNLAAEDECFLGALRAGLGVRTLSSAWETYEHVSDQGVAVEAYQREFGSPPAAHLLADTIERFVIALVAAHRADPLRPIRGAIELLEALPNRGWAVALATGAWRRAADFKLAAAGIDVAGLPIATSEDGPSRVDIVTTAIARAERRCGAAFSRTVAVGDAVWDVATARTLALPFVGIASGARADRLRRAGARTVLPDFVNAGSVVSVLETATVPGSSGNQQPTSAGT